MKNDTSKRPTVRAERILPRGRIPPSTGIGRTFNPAHVRLIGLDPGLPDYRALQIVVPGAGVRSLLAAFDAF